MNLIKNFFSQTEKEKEKKTNFVHFRNNTRENFVFERTENNSLIFY